MIFSFSRILWVESSEGLHAVARLEQERPAVDRLREVVAQRPRLAGKDERRTRR